MEHTTLDVKPLESGSGTLGHPEPSRQSMKQQILISLLCISALVAAFSAGHMTARTSVTVESDDHTVHAMGLRNQENSESALEVRGSLTEELSEIWAAIEGLRTDTGTQNTAITNQLNQESADRQAAVSQFNVSLQATFTNLEDLASTTSANLASDLQQAVSHREEAVANATSNLQSSIDALNTNINADLVTEAAAREASDANLENILACRPGLIRDPNDSTKCIPCLENQFWSARTGGCSDCPAHSTATPGSTSCTCDEGYEGTEDGANGLTCTATDVDECVGVTCQNGGTCQDQVNGYVCNCAAGYEGTHCETDVDECVGVTCQNGGTCQDQVNGYVCNCAAGYEGTHCETDSNGGGGPGNGINCASADNGGCGVHSTCTDVEGGRTCACDGGYASPSFPSVELTCDGFVPSANFDNTQLCVGCQSGRFQVTCSCPVDITSLDDRTTPKGSCGGGGYLLDGSSICTAGMHAGKVDPTNGGSFVLTLVAPPTGVMAGTTAHGITSTDGSAGPGALVFIVEGQGGACGDEELPVSVEEGTNCGDVNECATNNGNCGAGAVCTNTVGSYSCACDSGYTGTPPSCADVNECATANGGCPTNAVCANGPGAFTCSCETGSASCSEEERVAMAGLSWHYSIGGGREGQSDQLSTETQPVAGGSVQHTFGNEFVVGADFVGVTREVSMQLQIGAENDGQNSWVVWYVQFPNSNEWRLDYYTFKDGQNDDNWGGNCRWQTPFEQEGRLELRISAEGNVVVRLQLPDGRVHECPMQKQQTESVTVGGVRFSLETVPPTSIVTESGPVTLEGTALEGIVGDVCVQEVPTGQSAELQCFP